MRIPLVLVALVLTGCLSASVRPPSVEAGEREALALSGERCTWGGGHSIHTHAYDDILPPPWKPADVVEDIGVQPSYSDPGEQVYGVATSGWGNWHTNFVCDAWSLSGVATPLTLGMVITRIEPPPFDAAPVHRNYIVNVLASDNAALNDALMMTGWMSMTATGATSWDNGVYHHMLDTQMHGRYESAFFTRDAGTFDDTTMRLWFQKENADKTFSPIALDLTLSRAPGRAIAEPEGYFSHTNTDDHVLLAGQPQGTYGQIGGLVLSGFDAQFAWGPHPDVKLEKAYLHL